MNCSCLRRRDGGTVHEAVCMQVAIKCPWQWREPFLNRRKTSLKRRLEREDPVDPFHSKDPKLQEDCIIVELEEVQNIQTEIERLRAKRKRHAEWGENSEKICNSFNNSSDQNMRDNLAPLINDVSDKENLTEQVTRFLLSPAVVCKKVVTNGTEIQNFQPQAEDNGSISLLSDYYDGYLACCGEDPIDFFEEKSIDSLNHNSISARIRHRRESRL